MDAPTQPLPLRHGILVEGDEDELSPTVFQVLEFVDVIGPGEKHFEVEVGERAVGRAAASDAGPGDPIRRVREIRRDNLMRLWALHSIIHEKPDTLVELSPPPDDAADERAAARKPKRGLCAFCKKNGEPTSVYEGHCLRNSRGHVLCPILARHKCEVCGATGKNAHTMSHCPHNEDRGKENLPPFRLLANGSISTSHNHK